MAYRCDGQTKFQSQAAAVEANERGKKRLRKEQKPFHAKPLKIPLTWNNVQGHAELLHFQDTARPQGWYSLPVACLGRMTPLVDRLMHAVDSDALLDDGSSLFQRVGGAAADLASNGRIFFRVLSGRSGLAHVVGPYPGAGRKLSEHDMSITLHAVLDDTDPNVIMCDLSPWHDAYKYSSSRVISMSDIMEHVMANGVSFLDEFLEWRPQGRMEFAFPGASSRVARCLLGAALDSHFRGELEDRDRF